MVINGLDTNTSHTTWGLGPRLTLDKVNVAMTPPPLIRDKMPFYMLINYSLMILKHNSCHYCVCYHVLINFLHLIISYCSRAEFALKCR